MPEAHSTNFKQCGREITLLEIEEITETVVTFPNLNLNTLIETICEHLSWFTATGRYKKDACLKLLRKLEEAGLFQLPVNRPYTRVAPIVPPEKPIALPEQKHQEIYCDFHEIGSVVVEPVIDKEDITLWNQYVDRYHYLGYKRPFGCFMRYFVKTTHGDILGCALYAGAAKAITARDQWIGWSSKQRLRNLPWVINNTRFVIMPWVKVSCLASHILGQINRRISSDWQKIWGYRPFLMETFVDPAKYSGTCYRAANWQELGNTTGQGLVRKGKSYSTTPKLIFVRPLSRNFRKQLCREYLIGRIVI
jgi:hypothetical protein